MRFRGNDFNSIHETDPATRLILKHRTALSV
jgi:hypothetical protein